MKFPRDSCANLRYFPAPTGRRLVAVLKVARATVQVLGWHGFGSPQVRSVLHDQQKRQACEPAFFASEEPEFLLVSTAALR